MKNDFAKEIIDILEKKEFYGRISLNFNKGEVKDIEIDHRFNKVNFEKIKGQPLEQVDLITV